MDDLKTRVITASIVAPFVVLCFVSYESLIGLVSAIVILAGYEFITLEMKERDARFFYVILLALYPVLYGLVFEEPTQPLSILFITGVVFSLIADKDPSQVFKTIASFSIALIYITFFLSFFLPIYRNFGAANALLVLTSTWVFDSFAYFAGLKFGKTRISPRYSPRKSLEGVIGGFLGVVIYTFLYRLVVNDLLSVNVIGFGTFLPFAATVAVMDTFGDIFESALKRHYGVKDSGKTLPGHGGMLDRIDGLLFVAPVSYIVFKILEGVVR
ncbi:phosphatidate cytidylyltransferase [Thermotoga petrophila RKU-10]|uniref:Phosphatidate cytidylyltransferase n=1 Tax=Thermotoga petrophila (strain ATCC BAA-489 / DSM 13996 / JCM 10882 / RKU-10) TaxID=590168 RepID=D2C434_THEP2|nr:phosphatidate cytidylyltransferase [Thermotoga petrophila]ADA67488.1 phosphatidate cytidylyltransferase [Thermotoga petrophila RKU-10]